MGCVKWDHLRDAMGGGSRNEISMCTTSLRGVSASFRHPYPRVAG